MFVLTMAKSRSKKAREAKAKILAPLAALAFLLPLFAFVSK
jgi:hypothetical protein